MKPRAGLRKPPAAELATSDFERKVDLRPAWVASSAKWARSNATSKKILGNKLAESRLKTEL